MKLKYKRRRRELTQRMNALYCRVTHSSVTPGVVSTDTLPNSSCVRGRPSSPYAWTEGKREDGESESECGETNIKIV